MSTRNGVGRPTSHDVEEQRLLVGVYEVGGVHGLPPPPDPRLFSPEQFVWQLEELGISKGTHLTVGQLLALIDLPGELNERP